MAEIGYTKIYINRAGKNDELVRVVMFVRADTRTYTSTGLAASLDQALRDAIRELSEKSGFPRWYIEMMSDSSEVQEPLL